MIATSEASAASSASRIEATWPSIMPLGATMWAPAPACATAIRRYRSSVASLSTFPASSRTPQCPWSVYSSKQRSAMTTASSPNSVRTEAIDCCAIPSGFQASDPSASFVAGTAKSMNDRTPRSAISTASLRSDSIVCWNCPGIDGIGDRSVRASFTNRGAIRSPPSNVVSRTRARRAGVRRSRRNRCSGNAISEAYRVELVVSPLDERRSPGSCARNGVRIHRTPGSARPGAATGGLAPPPAGRSLRRGTSRCRPRRSPAGWR